MLEQAQNRRLLADSDSDEEPAKPRPNPTAHTKPTDILQEVRGAQPALPFPSPAAVPCSSVCPLCPCLGDTGLVSRLSGSQRPSPCALG